MRTLKVDYSSLFAGLNGRPDSYRVLADEYEWVDRDVQKHAEGLRFDEFQGFLDQQLAGEKGTVIVECGCGLGGNLVRFSRNNHCVGVDFSMTALRKIRAHDKAIHSTAADIRALPLRNGCADYVIFSRVLFIYEDLLQINVMLREARRILKSGGKVILINDFCSAGIWLATTIRDLFGFVGKLIPSRKQRELEFMLYYFSRTDVLGLLAESGLELVETRLCNVHLGLFHLTYYSPFLGLALRSLRRFYQTRDLDHWERTRQAQNVNDAYPLNWLGRAVVWLSERRFPGLGALTLCNLAVKR